MFLRGIESIFQPKQLKICCFGIMNNPEYRQEPWRESIRQRLNLFDSVCLVCGNKEDLVMLESSFKKEWDSGKLVAIYKPWPFPEWSYEELPRHLNEAISLARKQNCDWLIKLDLDTTFHEKDKNKIKRALSIADILGKKIVAFKKMQFFSPYRYWVKGYLPIAIRPDSNIFYGFDSKRYTDLCQPILWDENTLVNLKGVQYDIPSGKVVPVKYIYKSMSVKVFNYDFTFRTYERSLDLLFYIEKAHAKFWGKGYSGTSLRDINKETAMSDFLALSKNKYSKMNKNMEILDHPKVFRDTLSNLKPDQWGVSMWGKF